MYLLDTVVLSALRRRSYPEVARWVAGQRAVDLYISVVSIGEIERNIARLLVRHRAEAAPLAAWLDEILATYHEQLLPFGLVEARRWGQLSAAIANNEADLMIAATALEHGMTVVTCNVGHFAPTGVATFSPFE
jgi:predicted nucleic acid-binding protein